MTSSKIFIDIFFQKLFILASLTLLLLLALFSSPLLFEHLIFVNKYFRLVLGVSALVFLLLASNRINRIDILIGFFVFINFLLEFLWKSKIQNILSYFSIISVYFLFLRILKLNQNYRRYFLKMWIQIAYLASISSIALFLINQFTNIDTNIFKLETWVLLSPNNFKFHLFGITLDKPYGPFTLTRVYGYFIEPQYAGFYFTMNLLIASYIGDFKNKKYWVLLNLIAGMVTFSTTFFLSLVPISLLAFTGIKFRILFYLLFLTLLSIFIFEYDDMKQSEVFNLTSFADREIRFKSAIKVIEKSDDLDMYLGHGVEFQNEYGGPPFSAGFFIALIERGLLGLTFLFLMISFAHAKRFTVLIVLLLYLFAAPLYVNYLFWISILAIWAADKRRRDLKQNMLVAA